MTDVRRGGRFRRRDCVGVAWGVLALAVIAIVVNSLDFAFGAAVVAAALIAIGALP